MKRSLKLDEILVELEELNHQVETQKKEIDFYTTELARIKGLSMFEFANEFCTSSDLEDAGHALARSLGVGSHTMTAEEIAIDEAENAYVPYSGDDF